MWSQPRLMRPLPLLTPTPARRTIATIKREHTGWLRRLSAKYSLPRAELLRMLDRPGALEDEIGLLISEIAAGCAREIFDADDDAPDGDDLFTRAVRGVHARLVAARDAAEQAERMKGYHETDDLLRRMKAGEETD